MPGWWSDKVSRTWREPALALVGLGLATEAIYIVAAVSPFFLPEHYARPLLDLGKLTAYGRTAGIVFLIVTATLFALYGLAFRLARRGASVPDGVSLRRLPPNRSSHNKIDDQANAGAAIPNTSSGRKEPLGRIVVTFSLLFAVTLVFVYPIGAADLFDYVFYGRMIGHYGVNAFLHAPSEFAGDPLLAYVAWPNLPFTYGPLWATVSGTVGMLAGDNLLANLLLYKALAVAAYLAAILLIRGILREIAPRYTAAGMLLFAWNPLVVTETAANGHNDVVMMALLLGAIRLLTAREERPRLLALTLAAGSAMTKFVTAMLAPLFLVGAWRSSYPGQRRVQRLLAGVAIALLAAVALYAPFWQGPATLAVQRRGELFTTSFGSVIKLALEGGGGIRDAKMVGVLILAGFAAYALVEALRLAPGVNQLIAASHRVTLAYLLFASLWFQPWYLIWLIALAALRPQLDMARLSMVFSFSAAAANYFVFDYLWIWNSASLDFLAVQAIAVAGIYAPPLLFGLWLLLARLRRSRQDKAWMSE